jgi:hypothetical protein
MPYVLNFSLFRSSDSFLISRLNIDALTCVLPQRYNLADKRTKLPKWIQNCLHSEAMDLSIERAVSQARLFMRQMAQPHKKV